MFSKADIRRVNIVVPAARYSDIMLRLGKNGLVHPEKEHIPGEVEADRKIKKGALSVYAETAERIISVTAEFLGDETSAPDEENSKDLTADDIASLFSRDASEDLREVEHISKKKSQYENVRASLEQLISSAEVEVDGIRRIHESGIDTPRIKDLKLISYLHGKISGSEWIAGLDRRWFYILNGDNLLLFCPSTDIGKAEDFLKSNGFSGFKGTAELGSSLHEVEKAVEDRIATLKERIARIDLFYDKERQRWSERLAYLSSLYKIFLRITAVEPALRFSDEFILISGWMNIKNSELLWKELGRSCGNGFYLWIATKKENRRFRGRIPVLLKNNRLFRPFELLVKMIGTPGNSEVDPTPAAAIAYTVIFGVMFGDAGQGLVLAATGFLLSKYGMKRYGERNNISDFGGIMIWCGFSATLFGFMYGSVFSYEHFIPALLFHPMENMMELFIITITMGVVFISAGLVFNIFNGIIAGRYEEALFGTRGAAGLTVYLSIIFFVMRYVAAGVLPQNSEITAFLVPPGVFFVLRGPLGYFLFHGEDVFQNGIFEYIVESLVEIIEMFSNFLGNTISFIRAGAFALSHAGLSIAVFTLAGIIDPALRSAGAIAAIVTGNLFIILLEGLVCSIQSMRLEYYEFFGKFFRGDGTAFVPFSLKFR